MVKTHHTRRRRRRRRRTKWIFDRTNSLLIQYFIFERWLSWTPKAWATVVQFNLSCNQT
jgi:hypothetical protein